MKPVDAFDFDALQTCVRLGVPTLIYQVESLGKALARLEEVSGQKVIPLDVRGEGSEQMLRLSLKSTGKERTIRVIILGLELQPELRGILRELRDDGMNEKIVAITSANAPTADMAQVFSVQLSCRQILSSLA